MLQISLKGWEKIFSANGAIINSSQTDNFIFINIIDLIKKIIFTNFQLRKLLKILNPQLNQTKNLKKIK